MKALLGLGIWTLAALAKAEVDLGVKSDVIASPVRGSQPIVSGMDLLRLVISLVVVLALVKFVLPKLLGKFGGRLSTTAGSSIRVEESAHFASGQLYVVSVRSRTLLLSAGTHGVRCLADLTPGVPNANTAQNFEDPPAFFEVLDAKTDALGPADTSTPTLDFLRSRQGTRST